MVTAPTYVPSPGPDAAHAAELCTRLGTPLTALLNASCAAAHMSRGPARSQVNAIQPSAVNTIRQRQPLIASPSTIQLPIKPGPQPPPPLRLISTATGARQPIDCFPAQSNEIALLKEQLQALLARPHLPTSSPHQTSQPIALQTPLPPPPAPRSASSSAASSRAASPSRSPPHKRRSSTEPAGTPEMEAVIRHTASFLEAHERRIMAAITAVRTDTQSWMAQIDNRMANIEARQSSLEADLAQMTINVSSLLPSSSSPKHPATAGAPRPHDGQTPPAP
nr:putative uncharacterized protein DDB_G0290521 [Dermacentor andersoni]XP_050029291.1 putative uncharacterized protein DDB_G0290521 [Dermacentor andersoni]